jgi:hypothetical protein
MTAFEGMPINFTFSAETLSEIEVIRAEWQEKFKNNPAVVMVAWGEFYDHQKRIGESVVISFYTEDMRDEIAKGIEKLQGLEVLFQITRENYARFERKIIHHSKERGFFLR